MNQTVVIIAGGVAVVGGVILYRRFQAAKTSPAPDKCAAFAGIVGDVAGTAAGPADLSANSSAQQAAYLACKVASSIPWDKIANAVGLDPKGCGDWHKRNVELHGAPRLTIHPVLAAYLERERRWSQPPICTNPGVIEYGDGWIPYADENGKPRPGYKNAGDRSMSKWPARAQGAIATGRLYNETLRTGDPLTRKHTAAIGTFPMKVAAGSTAYWVRGQPMVCAAGQTIALDHRGDPTGPGIPVCWAASSPPPERRDEPGGLSDLFGLFGHDGRSTGGAQVPGTTTTEDGKTTTTYDHR
jgi:hypothetical protein